MIPQVIITLGPEGQLQIELPGKAGYREVVQAQLSKKPSGLERQLTDLLTQQQTTLAERAAELRAEKAAERAAKRRPKQPDWRLIARHPEAEIRERLAPVQVTQVPMAGGGKLTVQKVRKSLEDMNL